MTNPSTAKREEKGKAISTERQASSSGNGLQPGASGNSGKFLSRMLALLPWARKGGLAVLDQALISGSNFVISVLLARWLMPDQYGAYAVAFGIYVMLTLVYQSLVLEPMGVFGGSIFRSNLRGYVRSLLSIHAAFSVAICSALVIAWAVARHVDHGGALTGALAGVAIASPCLLLFALARRTFYVELSPAPATIGAFIYSTVVLAGLYFVFQRSLLSPFVAFLLIGLGALVTALVLMVAVRSGLSGSGPAPAFREAWRRHWRYGRWALAGCVAGWLPSYIYYPLLSSFRGMAESGQLKALMNLTMPFEQTKGALVMLFLPYAARVMEQQGKAGARVLGIRLTFLSVFLAIAYWAVIIPLHTPVFHILYSGRYMEVAYLLPALAFGQIFWSGTFGPSIALRAMESPASVFWALGVATVTSLVVGVPATWAFGLKGAIWGSNMADIFSLAALVLVLRHKLSTHGSGDHGSADAPSRSGWLGARGEGRQAVTLEISATKQGTEFSSEQTANLAASNTQD
jgi:O-antigen/teichoic acid export membrane protein